MADWFARLMQRGHARARPAIAGAGISKHADVGSCLDSADARYDAIVRALRDREVADREAREKRQRWYKQSLESESGVGASGCSPDSPTRLYKFRTKVPCRATPEARALLHELRKQFAGSTVTFPRVSGGRQAVMLTRRAGANPRQIGWVEHCVETDPQLCNVRHQGLSVETDGGTMLVLRFRYPPTSVRMSCKRNAVTSVDFTEIRPALDLRPSDKGSSPRLVWITRPEVETMNALRSRDYEAFYVRFKLELQAGIWYSLSGLLSSSPGAQWNRGSYYTVVREPDAANRKIYERTVDDSGRAVDVGLDRTYDVAAATDILLLYLDGDILADVADIYFALQSLSSADAYFLKEEFFALVRRFWASSQSLASRYGSDVAAVVRMAQRVLPVPPQAPLLKQDWTNLRQSLVDRYGEGGRKAADLVGQHVYRPRTEPLGWPFASFPAGEVNVGLRLVYRQEWRQFGAQGGGVIPAVPAAPERVDRESADVTAAPTTLHGAQGSGQPLGGGGTGQGSVETAAEPPDAERDLDEIVDRAVKATVEAMKWPVDFEGTINTGIRPLAANSDMGLELECRESSRDTSTRLSDIVRRMAKQNLYEVMTRPAELQNVVLVAEKLPTPAEIDLSWVRRHEGVLTKVLLDESVRDALDAIGQDAAASDASRTRLYEYVRANILYYQRAIWQQEDPQQRSMRYRKSGKKVPLEWRFELESGPTVTIEELGDRLAATNVDGQFAAYAGGREADLDQVIDPAGPIGYYGNYAIYPMRPEYGSEDLFSMLHFFKSPYLRANPETGEPEVEDPVQIQISGDPAAVAASARATDARRSDAGIDPGQAPAGYQLTLESGRADVVVSANGHRDPQTECAILRSGGERMLSLLVGAGGRDAGSCDPDAEPVIGARGDRGVRLTAGAGAIRAHERPILAGGDGEQTPSLHAGAGPADARERIIVSRGGELRVPSLRAGRPHDPGSQPIVPVRDDGRRLPSLRPGGARDQDAERMILTGDAGRLKLTAVAGGRAVHAHERVILARYKEWLRPSLVAG